MSKTTIYQGDCLQKLKLLEDNSVDLIVTSPPYADQRKNTYGGISTNKYVDWFLPISAELLRVLKPTGTFILNTKEKVQNGERITVRHFRHLYKSGLSNYSHKKAMWSWILSWEVELQISLLKEWVEIALE